jgi:hypothetical protein
MNDLSFIWYQINIEKHFFHNVVAMESLNAQTYNTLLYRYLSAVALEPRGHWFY